MTGIKVVKIVSQLWMEWEAARLRGSPFRQLVDKDQYIFSSSVGEISMVYFINYFRDGDNFYEIYSTRGNLFEDVERFGKREDAVIRINELLEV